MPFKNHGPCKASDDRHIGVTSDKRWQAERFFHLNQIAWSLF